MWCGATGKRSSRSRVPAFRQFRCPTIARMTDDASLTTEVTALAFPGARRPDRRRDVMTSGLRISVAEWGDPDAPPLMLAHGGFDFAETHSVFAPLLAAGGWRVVSWDQRGHGHSDWGDLYSWDADVRDGRRARNAG